MDFMKEDFLEILKKYLVILVIGQILGLMFLIFTTRDVVIWFIVGLFLAILWPIILGLLFSKYLAKTK